MGSVSQMNYDALTIACQIEEELAAFGDAEIVAFIRAHVIAPRPLMLGWDYGPSEDATMRDWVVFEDTIAGARIVFCSNGFGLQYLWGLVSLKEEVPRVGTDSAWFPSFLDAFFDSFSSTRLNIYRVIATHPDGTRAILSEEGGWDETWEQVMDLRRTRSDVRYDCETLRFGQLKAP
jgi:hypothetical protein